MMLSNRTKSLDHRETGNNMETISKISIARIATRMINKEETINTESAINKNTLKIITLIDCLFL